MNRVFLLSFLTASAASCAPFGPANDPPIVLAGDAAALLDAGPDASPCARMCETLAAQDPPCREANGACIAACERVHAAGLLTDLTISCVAGARDRDAIHTCGVTCP